MVNGDDSGEDSEEDDEEDEDEGRRREDKEEEEEEELGEADEMVSALSISASHSVTQTDPNEAGGTCTIS